MIPNNTSHASKTEQATSHDVVRLGSDMSRGFPRSTTVSGCVLARDRRRVPRGSQGRAAAEAHAARPQGASPASSPPRTALGGRATILSPKIMYLPSR